MLKATHHILYTLKKKSFLFQGWFKIDDVIWVAVFKSRHDGLEVNPLASWTPWQPQPGRGVSEGEDKTG